MSSNEVIHLSDRETPSPNTRYRSSTPKRRQHFENNTPNRTAAGRRRTTRSCSIRYKAEVINVEAPPRDDRLGNGGVHRRNNRQRGVKVEVINLDDGDTSPLITPKQPQQQLNNTPGKRRRHNRDFHSINSRASSDNDIIEISSPQHVAKSSIRSKRSTSAFASAASAAWTSNKQQSPTKSAIDRIREVFPTLSRSKVQTLLTKAKSYSKDNNDDDDLVQIVMMVLADHPTGENITDRIFAAAAVGGKIDIDPHHDDDNTSPPSSTAAGTRGKKKVAQLECNCCYVEYDFEQMVSCKYGHLFCKTCLQKHTETRVFGLGNFGVVDNGNGNSNKKKAVEITCMHSDGCDAGFHEGHLRRALSDKVMKKYDELQYQAVVEGFSDTSKCPKCDYIAFVDEAMTTFRCVKCNFNSCRECGEEAHPGKRCDEVENQHETKGRNTVEEAMTNAVIRKCPRPMCRKPFMKTDGCNKITCSCGAFICYICRKEIPKHIAYKHFCQTPHCNHKSCNKCGLYADADTADKLAMQAAAKEAAKAVSTGRKGVTVNVDELLKNPQPDPHARNTGLEDIRRRRDELIRRQAHQQNGRRRPAGVPFQQHAQPQMNPGGPYPYFPPPPQYAPPPHPHQMNPYAAQHQMNPYPAPHQMNPYGNNGQQFHNNGGNQRRRR